MRECAGPIKNQRLNGDRGQIPRIKSTCNVMRAFVAKLIRKCLHMVRSSADMEREAQFT